MKTTDFNNPYDFVKSNETMPDYSAANIYNETWNFNGELTETGKRMHYLIGVHNRNKYILLKAQHNIVDNFDIYFFLR